jgi:hypothetical protein
MEEIINKCKILNGIPEGKRRLDEPVLLGRMSEQESAIMRNELFGVRTGWAFVNTVMELLIRS